MRIQCESKEGLHSQQAMKRGHLTVPMTRWINFLHFILLRSIDKRHYPSLSPLMIGARFWKPHRLRVTDLFYRNRSFSYSCWCISPWKTPSSTTVAGEGNIFTLITVSCSSQRPLLGGLYALTSILRNRNSWNRFRRTVLTSLSARIIFSGESIGKMRACKRLTLCLRFSRLMSPSSNGNPM